MFTFKLGIVSTKARIIYDDGSSGKWIEITTLDVPFPSNKKGVVVAIEVLNYRTPGIIKINLDVPRACLDGDVLLTTLKLG